MNDIQKANLSIAVLVRLFPNIVQTYVLNHIIGMKNIGVKTVIIAEKDPHQSEIHPAVYEHKLLEDTVYIDTDSSGLKRQFLRVPFASARYWGAVSRILFSGIIKRHGFKFCIKAIASAGAVSEHDYEIVHSHSLFNSYDYLYMKEVFGIPMTTTFHGLVPGNVKMLEPNKIRAVLDTTDAFYVNTQFACNQLLDFGCDRNKIHIIPQGTNTADFPFRDRAIPGDAPAVILSVGRLSREKGFHIAINAIAELIANDINIEYRIVGDGIERENLSEQIEQLGLQNNVKLLGSISTAELSSHYADAHIFVLPSIDLQDGTHTETQGVVLQEAQSSGLPVIASRTGGIPEVIRDGETGLLFDQNNTACLARHIQSLVADPTQYQSLCLNGRRDVDENYSMEVIYGRLMAVYRVILNRTKSA